MGSLSFSIPTIDLSPFLSNPTSPEALEIVSAIKNACITTGFFQMTGHGIPVSLQEAVFKSAEEVFKLPMEEKVKLDKTKSVGASNRGYELIGGQGLQEGTLPDLKEGYYVGRHIPETDPRVQNSAFLIGPNIWPPTSLIPDEIFKNPCEEYFSRIYDLSLKVLDAIVAGMPYGPHIFDEFAKDAVASIRLLHYPPDISNDERQLGAGAHTDFGAITLLLQDQIGGLQVWDYGNKEWVDVKPVKDAYVVNVGDMLQMWTSGLYKSSLHRVLNKGGKDRYSIPFFFDGNVDFVLTPLGGGEEGKKYPTVEEHMRARFGQTYGRGMKREDGEENYKE